MTTHAQSLHVDDLPGEPVAPTLANIREGTSAYLPLRDDIRQREEKAREMRAATRRFFSRGFRQREGDSCVQFLGAIRVADRDADLSGIASPSPFASRKEAGRMPLPDQTFADRKATERRMTTCTGPGFSV